MAERELRPEPGETLTQLREALDPPQSAATVAREINASRTLERALNQRSVSRYETGSLLPSDEHLDALLEHYDADETTAERLRDLAARRRAGQRRVVAHRIDAPRHQREFRVYERESTRIRSFTATIAPGALQTEDYTRAVVGAELAETERQRWLDERTRRRALVEEGDRYLEFVLTAGSLLVNRGGAAVMRAQIDRLVEASRLPHVHLGVIDARTDIGSAAVLNNITLYERADGRRRVVIGTSHATELLAKPADIDHQVAILDRLAALAVWGDQARAVLLEVRRTFER